jgi:cytoskeleton protein RodZ
MTSVGETLRRERLRKELDLEQISRETKISPRLLEAIEQDDFDRLPGGVFARSFVRQYARFLGLDEEELASEVQKLVESEPELPNFAQVPAEPVFKVPKVTAWEGGSKTTSSALPSLAMVVAVMLACSGIYAWWQRSRRPAPPPAPPAASAPKTAEPPRVTRAVSHAATPPSGTEVARSTPATPQAGNAAAPPADESAAAAANPAQAMHVRLTVDDTCWVRAWADGDQVMTRVLQPNMERTVEAVKEVRLRTGNAGALQITVNGKPVGPVGPKGQIRIVQITPKGVQILLPPPPSPAPAPEPEPL